MRSLSETTAVDRFLRNHGLPGLAESGVIPAMARMIEDHWHFSRLLAACDPAQRREMYEALRPHLSFNACTLDDYEIAAKRYAESQRMPTVDAKGGLHPSEAADVKTAPTPVEQDVIDSANRALAEITAKWHLVMVCRKCTRQQVYPGQSKAQAICRAREAGWMYDEINGDGFEICPDCPGAKLD